MRKILFTLLLIFTLMLSLSASSLFAQGSTTTRSVIAQENLRSAFSRDGQEPGVRTRDPYDAEKQLLSQQLQIVTGEDEHRYLVDPGDTFKISFQDRGEKNEALYKVSGSGEIYLPLAGNVKLAGLTRAQARQMITEVLEQYIREPDVQIFVNVGGTVAVMGFVRYPDVSAIQPQMTVYDAIAAAGGEITNEAEMRSIILIRGPADKPVGMRLYLKKMFARGHKSDKSDNILLKPGDLVYVPRTFMSHMDQFMTNITRFVSFWYGLSRRSKWRHK